MKTSLLALLLLLAPTAQAADMVQLKLATVAPEGSPWATALQTFKAKAEAAAPGKVKVKLFLGGTLGDENETVLAVKRGQIQAVGASTGALASQVPEFAVTELPYVFKNFEEVDRVTSDPGIKADIEKHCADRGLVFGFWSENGFRSFGGKFKISRPEDLKGRKMRSQEQPSHLAFYRALGASPVPIPTTEALTALQTGVVDGYDQAALYLFAASWHTATKNYSTTNHIYQGAAIVFNKQQWDTWPAEVQKALRDAGASIEADLKKQVRAMVPILLQNLGEMGVTVDQTTEPERAAFLPYAEKARAEYLKGATAGEKALFKKMEAVLKAARAGKK
jgi:tripartite ATP-independent transporter DctP family solute receptor